MGAEAVANLAGDGFTPGARWEMLYANENDVCKEDGIRLIRGETFREPTVSEEEVEEGINGATKKNYDETFDRAPFISKAKHPVFTARGKLISS